MEEIEFIIEACKESMSNSIDHLEKELINIRAGKANPSMLSSIKLDYYGSMTPLSQIANINTPDAQTISIQPWEKDKLQDTEQTQKKFFIMFVMENFQVNTHLNFQLEIFFIGQIRS